MRKARQRRVFANAEVNCDSEYAIGDSMPMTLWFSEVGNLDNFWADRPADDSDPFSPTIPSSGPANIRWTISYDDMLVLLTDCGLFSIGFAQSVGFCANSCRISKFSDVSVSPTIMPVMTDAGIIFVGADNKTLYTIAYDLNENKLKPASRSVMVEHITKGREIKSIALQEYPDNVVWICFTDGEFACFTFEKSQEVFAWSTGSIPGVKVRDILTLGTIRGARYETRSLSEMVFVCEKNVTSGIGDSFVCTFNANMFPCIDRIDAVDPTTGIVENVKAEFTTLRPESQERTIAGAKKNAKDCSIRLHRTGNLKVRPVDDRDYYELVTAKTTNDSLYNDLFTGDVKFMPGGYINDDGQMAFVSDDGKPCEILSVLTTMEVNQ